MTIPANHRALSSGALAPGAGTPHGSEALRLSCSINGMTVHYFAKSTPMVVTSPLRVAVSGKGFALFREVPIKGRPGWYRLQLRKQKAGGRTR